LEEEVAAGTFRQDLFFRLNVMVLEIPPLRERREDIPLLCALLLQRLNKKMNLGVEKISSDAMELLMNREWSGNVRELENSLERALIFAEGNKITAENLPRFIETPESGRRIEDILGTGSLKKAQKILEKRLIGRTLEATKGNKSSAARKLEISYPSLLGKIKEYGL
jgi:two-component system response regulator AtoC